MGKYAYYVWQPGEARKLCILHFEMVHSITKNRKSRILKKYSRGTKVPLRTSDYTVTFWRVTYLTTYNISENNHSRVVTAIPATAPSFQMITKVKLLHTLLPKLKSHTMHGIMVYVTHIYTQGMSWHRLLISFTPALNINSCTYCIVQIYLGSKVLCQSIHVKLYTVERFKTGHLAASTVQCTCTTWLIMWLCQKLLSCFAASYARTPKRRHLQ